MKFLLLTTLLSPSVFAQLEKPILDGRCGKIILKIQNDIIRAEIPKKNSGRRICTFKPIEGSSADRPTPNATIYLVPVMCDGKMNGTPGFDMGNVSPNSFLQVFPQAKKGKGVFSVYSDQQASLCQFKVVEWEKVKKMAVIKR